MTHLSRWTRASALLMGAALLLGSPAQADEPTATEQCLAELVGAARAQGWRLRGTDSADVAKGATVDYRLTLYNGSSYLFMACAGGEGADLNLNLYDEAGGLTDADRSSDARPFVEASPAVTGEYTLQVLLYDYATEQGDFSMALLYR